MSLTNEAKWFKFMIRLPCIPSVVFVGLCVSLCWRSVVGLVFLAYFPRLAWGIDRFFWFPIFTMKWIEILSTVNVLCMHFHIYVYSPACTPDLKNFHEATSINFPGNASACANNGYFELWTPPIGYKLCNFFVTKNKIAENDLQLLKVLTLRKNVVRRATRRSFCDIASRCKVMSRCFKEFW